MSKVCFETWKAFSLLQALLRLLIPNSWNAREYILRAVQLKYRG